MGRGPQREPSDPADLDQAHESAVHILGLLAGDKHQPGTLRDDSGVLVAKPEPPFQTREGVWVGNDDSVEALTAITDGGFAVVPA